MRFPINSSPDVCRSRESFVLNRIETFVHLRTIENTSSRIILIAIVIFKMADYESNIIIIVIVIFKMADYESNIIVIVIFKMADYKSNLIVIVIFNLR